MVETLINLEKNIKAVSLQEFRTNLVPDIEKRIKDVQEKLNLWLPLLKYLDARKRTASSVHYQEREVRDLVSRLQNVLEVYFNVVKPRRGRSKFRKFIDDFKSFRMVDLEIKGINMQIMLTIRGLFILEDTKITDPETETRQKLRKSISDDSRENHIVGMDDQVKNLKSVLLDGKDGVICIYGCGGIGKTALAQQLPEGRKRIKHPGLTREALAEHFDKYAKDESYLFVLDDIRSLNDWNFLRGIFPKNQKGSKLMLTTRLNEVANRVYADDGHVHVMWPLSRTDSEKLFQKTAFLGDPDEDDSWRKDIMDEVLNLCSGLPSAIVAVREVLAAKRTSNEWKTVLQDIERLINRDLPVEQILMQQSISALIFYDLPDPLKLCFLYLGLFPKGLKIEVEHLYLQWMAEGMISRDDCQNNETMMDLAERYLSDLVQRKMVEVEEEETPSLRKYKSCCVHDTMQDQCLRQGNEYSFKVLDERSSDSFSSTRSPAHRMALHLGNEDDRSSVDQLRNEKVHHLRSLLLLNLCNHQMKLQWPPRMFNLKRYRVLRVLTFERVDFQERGLPRGMTWPIYLRYLSFKGCILKVLPSSIGKLSFLEILDLRVSGQVIIPNVLWKMVKLVYLYLPLEFQTPNNDKLYLGSLKELEILENIDPGVCNVADLFKMTRLRHLSTTVEGILEDLMEIVRLMDMTSENTSVSIKVRKFDCYTEERHSVFRKLLSWQILHTLHIDGHLGQIPPHNKITSSLTEMVLIGSQLKEDPMKTLDELPELQVLVLQDDAFVGTKMRCVKASFKKLKRLELLTLHSLEIWEVQKKSMPMLSILAVKNCRKLRDLPHGLRERVSSVTFKNDN
ncbi:unnamed protein product [Fraxinus pennsylvanica]|uniref:NB-ARC domain-containing protein n=1 Tax=Fraxinus pennsylvanica TaxID=56036 RepID=A0AAD1ZUL8_9LAMI|nr:unnamed protein product [Fraxinus pennsylvanica]